MIVEDTAVKVVFHFIRVGRTKIVSFIAVFAVSMRSLQAFKSDDLRPKTQETEMKMGNLKELLCCLKD